MSPLCGSSAIAAKTSPGLPPRGARLGGRTIMADNLRLPPRARRLGFACDRASPASVEDEQQRRAMSVCATFRAVAWVRAATDFAVQRWNYLCIRALPIASGLSTPPVSGQAGIVGSNRSAVQRMRQERRSELNQRLSKMVAETLLMEILASGHPEVSLSSVGTGERTKAGHDAGCPTVPSQARERTPSNA